MHFPFTTLRHLTPRGWPAIRRYGLAMLLLVVATTVFPQELEVAPSLADQVGEILADGYQTSLQGDPTVTVPGPLLQALLSLLIYPVRIVFWIAIAIVVALLVAYLISLLRGRRPSEEEDEDRIAGEQADDTWAEVGLNRADELARAGRTTEALHVLLLSALGELRRRGGIDIQDSLTSREILARVALPGDSQGPLGELVRKVEISFFGGRECGPEDYEAGRANFERVRGAMNVSAV